MKKKIKFIIHIRRAGKRIALLFFVLPFIIVAPVHPLAEWSVVTYIQADNNLEDFAYHNINAMKKVATSSQVNILVQLDQPANNKTWRYKVEKNKLLEAGSLSAEMGLNPEQELVDMMQWVKTNYPAKNYMMVLWNHGNGVLDRNKNLKTLTSWMEIPGAPKTTLASIGQEKGRGILYDDSQGTFLSNQALTRALSRIKSEVLGKQLDVIGMDACLMAMLEVAYQMKDHVRYFVGAQHTEPGDGWSYDGFLSPLVANPTSYDAYKLAQKAVYAYGNYYTWDRECTQSAIDLSKIDSVKLGIERIITNIEELKKTQSTQAKTLIKYARNKVIRFYTSAYVDLNSFYNCLLNKSRKLRKNKKTETPKPFRRFESVLREEMTTLQRAVIANVTGRDFKNAKGIAIYWPKWEIDSTYLNTSFAQSSSWLNFIQQN